MSWISKTQTDFIITTGDGREYRPKWLMATKGKAFNVTEYNFLNLPGTLVNRTTPMGRRYDIEIYFDGEFHLDFADAFDTSSDDPRPWKVAHPLYGSIIVQPISLNFDNSVYNITKITGTVVETITEDNPKTSIPPADKIITDKETLHEVLALSFANDVHPKTLDINKLTDKTTAVYTEGKKAIKSNIDAEKYFNLYNTATASILKITSEPLATIQNIQAMLNYPGEFADGVKNRVKSMLNQLGLLRDSAQGLLSHFDKKTHEAMAGTIISTMAATTASPEDGDYGNRGEVLAVIDDLLTAYDDYIADLDGMQTENGGAVESFIPDAASLLSLNALVKFTVSNLFNIALDSKQERSVIVEDDTNLILLAHRFYGLEPDDSTIDDLIRHNNIGLNGLLNIRKGTKLLYYV